MLKVGVYVSSIIISITVFSVVLVTFIEFANFGIAQGKVNNSTASLAPVKQSPSLYQQGYAKGIKDAKLVQSNFRASTIMSPEQVDCDSDIDPKADNEKYCSGYQQGFADTNNKIVSKKWLAHPGSSIH